MGVMVGKTESGRNRQIGNQKGRRGMGEGSRNEKGKGCGRG